MQLAAAGICPSGPSVPPRSEAVPEVAGASHADDVATTAMRWASATLGLARRRRML